ncbi:hypothetical protein PIIN_01900 [Serendipita indica DSM 11827]|uniref:Uncharacterized protein n=1 Tax=Serendipita indica (strain DSM 11827) TaxID=1109443 RepID=G4T9N2_SERID|nr:hypothetical protein PIIN_01900 [Serendipita indica DSM 11827]
MASEQGASCNERLLAAAKADDVDMLNEVFEEGDYDINFQDGLGNTALHYAAQYGSVDALDELLTVEGCDVDLQNRIMKQTPLHLACKNSDLDTRHYMVRSLLEAGADTSIKDKHGQRAYDLIPAADNDCRGFIREAEAQAAQLDDVADDDDDDVHSDDVASD